MPSADLAPLDSILGSEGTPVERGGRRVVTPPDGESFRVLVRSLAAARVPVWTEPGPRPPAARVGVHLRYPPSPPPELEPRSGVVRVGAGLDLESLERFLVARGHSLSGWGWAPPPVPVGTWLETGGRGLPWPPAAGLASRILHFRALLADGSEVEDGRAPRSAAGPDLRALWIGARGAFGALLEATLSVHRLGSRRGGWVLAAGPERLASAARDLALAKGPGETVLLLPPARLLYLASGERDLVEARVRRLERLASAPAERLEPAAFEAIRGELSLRVRGWIDADGDLGAIPLSRERAIEPERFPEWFGAAGGDWIVSVEDPRRFRALGPPEPGRPYASARPAAGPLARFASEIDPEVRWNP